MLEFFAILGLVFGTSGDVAQMDAVENSAVVEEAEVVPASDSEDSAAAAPGLPDPFPEFSAALTDCLTYFDQGDLSVFDDGTQVVDGVGVKSVFYPEQTNPPAMQVAVTQSGAVLSCGGTGAAAPRAFDLDTTYVLKLREIFMANDLVAVKFPEPTRVWANCGTGGDTFVMMVPGGGDLVVLSAAGNEPTAGVYCEAFGVKE